ncbi:MAG: hypothetical protein J5I91_08150 [Bacteroidetes bacterium]|nr:hypothetical protein [Bacteroidota bacterium]
MNTLGKKNLLFLIFLTSLLLQSFHTSAQKDSSEGNVFIIVPTNPSLSEGRKLEILPKITRNNQTAKPNFSYKTIDKFSQTSKDIHVLAPVAFFPEHKRTLPNGLAKVGYGNLNSWNGNFMFNNFSNANNAYGGSYNHYSSNIPKSNKDYSRNEAGAFAKIFSHKEEFGVSFDFSRDVMHFYNLPDSIEPTIRKKDVSRYLEQWNVNTYYKFGDINYVTKRPYFRTDLEFNRFNMSHFVYENSFQIKGHMLMEHESFIKTGSTQPLDIKLSTNIDHLRYSNANSYNRYFVWLKANEELTFDIAGKTVVANVGFNFDVYGDSLEPQAFITPNITAKIPLINKKAVLFLGTDGGYKKQGLQTLYTLNPFLQETPLLKNEFTSFRFFGGVDANVAPGTVLQLEASSAQIANMPLFVGSDDPYRRFSLRYDNGIYSYIKGQLNYNLGDKVWVNLSGKYNHYKMETEEEAWLYPDFEVKLSSHYCMSKKLFTHLDIISLGNRTALDENLNKVNLKALFDINLGAEYILNNGFLCFIQLNNLAGTMYQRWYQFPVYGFNATAGIGYRF